MLLVKVFKDNKEIIKSSFLQIKNIEKYLYDIVGENIFVYISKEDYSSLLKCVTDNIPITNFDDVVGENPKVSLLDILSKEVVFVKYNNKSDIRNINDLRKNFVQENFHVEIEKLPKELRYK